MNSRDSLHPERSSTLCNINGTEQTVGYISTIIKELVDKCICTNGLDVAHQTRI